MGKTEEKKNRNRIILGAVLALELILLAVSFAGIFRGERFYQSFTGAEFPAGEHTAALDRGSYEVTLDYEMKVDAVRITPMYEADYGADYAESILLQKEYETKTFELLLPAKAENFYFQLPELENPEDFAITSAEIKETGQADRVAFFVLFVFFALADGLYYLSNKKQIFARMTREQKGAGICLGLIILFSCVPLYVNYLTSGHDLTFHLMRIEGLAEGLRQGQFPVKMQPLWLNDYGYPVSIMYGDLFLYLPALLRIIGFSLQSCYKIYLAFIQIVTAVTSYVCLKEVAGSRKLGVVGCFLYLFATNRITNMFYRSAVGEFTALAFLPLVFLGLWYLLGKEETEECDRKRAFYLLAAGYTCMLQSHLLSFNIAIIFSLLYCLISWRRFCKNFLFLVKTGLVTIGLNLCFLVPMADYMLSHDMKVKFASNIENMQEHGLFLSQMFQMFCFPVSGSGDVMSGVGGDMAVGIGMVFMLILELFCWELLTFFIRSKKEGQAMQLNPGQPVKILVLFCISLLMSCYFFPWHALGRLPGVGGFLTPYQFAWRFIGIATFLGVVLAMYALRFLEKLTDRAIKVGAIAVLCTLTLIGSQYLMDHKLSSGDMVKVTSAASIDTRGAVAGGEYLFVESSVLLIGTPEPVPENETDLVIKNFEKKDSVVTMACENNASEERKIQVPFLDYKGYRATDKESGERLSLVSDEQHVLSVVLPGNFSGEVEVAFCQPWYWRAAELLSLAVLLAVVLRFGKDWRRK